MPEDAAGSLLLNSALTVIETMFFESPDEVSLQPQRLTGELVASCLSIQGTPPGRFGLTVSYPLAKTLAANFVGCDDPSSLIPNQVADVMGELANMICGAVLSKMESSAAFDLSSPESMCVGAEDSCSQIEAESPLTCRLEFAVGAIVCSLSFKEAT